MATKNTPDARRFVEVVPGYWLSHRTYKTRKGVETYINQLTRKRQLPYMVVGTSEFGYTWVSGKIVYRVAVKE